MSLLRALILSVVLSSAAMAQAPEPSGRAALIGQWRLVGADLGGRAVPPDQVMNVVVTFESDGRFRDTEGAEASWVVDETKSPNHIDLSHTAGRDAGKTQRCVFEVVGDRLTIVYHIRPDERPVSLTGNPNVAVFVFERRRP